MLAGLILALTAAAAPPTPPAPADAQAALARAAGLGAEGRYADAVDLLRPFSSAADLADAARGRVLARLADAEAQLGRGDQALADADRGERLARAADDRESLALLEAARGLVFGLRGEASDALAHYRRGLAWAEQSGAAAAQVAPLDGLAAWYEEAGDWTRALYYSERAFAAAPAASDHQRTVRFYRRGISYLESGDRDESEKSFLAGLALARRTGDARLTGLLLGELAGVYDTFDHDEARALRFYEDSLKVLDGHGLYADEAAYLNNEANVFRDHGDLAGALARYERAMALVERAHAGRTRPVLHKNIGQVLARLGRVREAEPLLVTAMHEADAAGLARFRWQARLELARLYERSDPAKAERFFREALRTLEDAHAGLLLDNFRAGALGSSIARYDVYDAYIDFLMARGRGRDAFEVAERGRARVFLETLASSREELASAAPAWFRDEERAILARISASQERLRDAAVDAAARGALSAGIDRDEQALTDLQLRLGVERPALASLRFPHLWTIDELQRRVIRDDETMVVYFLGATRSTCWAIGRHALQILDLPPRATIEAAVRAFTDALRRPGSGRADASALWPLLGLDRLRLPTSHLTIVPHGVLHYLPFEALAAPDGRALVERHVVSYAESASSAAYLRAPAPPAAADGPSLVAVGDPVARAAPAAVRGVDPREIGALKRLPHAGEELRRIARIVGPPVVLLRREHATEGALAEAVRGARIVHFATHALIDEDHPERSALALSPRPPAEDGILQMREIYRLTLTADLVTLSACDTALGRDVAGEGIIGMARAFYAAGARAVLASLWDVDDAATADFMAWFYEGIERGEPIDAALAGAKRRAIASGGRMADPYYWAAFVVSGDAWAAIPPARPEPALARRASAVLGAVVLLCTAWVAGARFRRSSSPLP